LNKVWEGVAVLYYPRYQCEDERVLTTNDTDIGFKGGKFRQRL